MRKTNRLRTTRTRLLALFMGVLIGCGTIQPPPPPIVWIVALDITTSISKEYFATMRDQMIPEIVLSRLRSRDVAYVLQIDSDPEDDVKRIAVNGGHVGFEKEITNIFRDSIHSIEQPPKYRGSTNIGGVLAFAARTAQELRTKGGPPVQVIVLVFSDGKLEGPQSGHRQEWPEGMQVWFWGVDPAQETALKEWTTKKLALGEERLTIIRWSDWQTMAAVFGVKTGRRLQDAEVVQQLHALGTTSLAVNKH